VERRKAIYNAQNRAKIAREMVDEIMRRDITTILARIPRRRLYRTGGALDAQATVDKVLAYSDSTCDVESVISDTSAFPKKEGSVHSLPTLVGVGGKWPAFYSGFDLVI
jgi:hypothetical protein